MSYRELEQRVIRIEKQVDQNGQLLQRNMQLLEAIILELGVLVIDEDVQITGFTLSQIQGGKEMPITGTQAGTTSTFDITDLPPNENVPLQSGPTVAVDDPNATVTQPDANNNITVAIPATDTATSYNVTISGVNGAGESVSSTFNVPITPAPVQITGFALNQIS